MIDNDIQIRVRLSTLVNALIIIGLLVLLYGQYRLDQRLHHQQQMLLSLTQALTPTAKAHDRHAVVIPPKPLPPSDISKPAQTDMASDHQKQAIQTITPADISITGSAHKPDNTGKTIIVAPPLRKVVTTPSSNQPVINKTGTKQNESPQQTSDQELANMIVQQTSAGKIPSIHDKPSSQDILPLLQRQLRHCRQLLNQYALTSGKNGNAYDCYTRILAQHPTQKDALQGIKDIETAYQQLIKKYLHRNNQRKVARYARKLLHVNPNSLFAQKYLKPISNTVSAPTSVPSGSTDTNTDAKADSIIHTSQSTDKPTATEQIPNMDNEMIAIKPGCVNNGDKEICVSQPFFIQKYEVTQQQWQLIMEENPARFVHCGAQCPIENVSWFEVQDFIRKLNKKTGYKYRLPTEAEWEYAARAGSSLKYGFADTADELYRYANYCDQQCQAQWADPAHNDGASITRAVGSYQPNAWGLYDMLGNVWEWTADHYQVDKDTAIQDSVDEQYSYRGCSWGDSAQICFIASRAGVKPDFKVSGLGFRLVRDQ